MTNESKNSLGLHLDVGEVKKDLALVDPQAINATEGDESLEQKAQEYADQVVSFAPDDDNQKDSLKNAVALLGRGAQKEASSRSMMLKQPIKALAKHGDEGGDVAKSLIDLKMEVEELDPNKFSFSAGWFSRLLGMIPGFGTPLKRYFSKYESSQSVIDAIINSLKKGKDQLQRDNITLDEDQKAMRDVTKKLENNIKMGQLLDQKIQHKLEREIPQDAPRRPFVEEEIVFPLRQRIIDLQQQLAVNQQGVLSIAIISKNNQELVRGVDRALDITVSALQVAVTVALALANQKIVLDKITMLSKTTSELIAGTAERLKTQGAEIHKQAAGSTLDMESLKSAFADINIALDEISSYRREALPQMAQTILDFDQLTAKGEEAVKKLEQTSGTPGTLELSAE